MIITPLYQTIVVRFARKPIWMPTARSKLFRIAENKFYTKEEVDQIITLRIAHQHQVESIQEHMKHEFFIPASQAGGLPLQFIEKETVEDKRLLEANDLENKRIAKLKEEFMTNRMRDLENKAVELKFQREEEYLEAAAKAEEFIRQNQGEDSFVTPENIEAMIDKALENPISHEFCIDRQGRTYR